LLLDPQGGPNHGLNFCDAGFIADAKADSIHFPTELFLHGALFSLRSPRSRVCEGVCSTLSELGGVHAAAFVVSPAAQDPWWDRSKFAEAAGPKPSSTNSPGEQVLPSLESRALFRSW
jgi:hypothetical protein